MNFVHFFLELCRRAADSSVRSMGTTYLALVAAALISLADIWVQFKHNGWAGVRQHWGRSLKYGFVAVFGWWVLLFSFHLIFKVPHEIRISANRIQAPQPVNVHLAPPQFAYLRSPHYVPKTPPSFVLVSPGPLLNGDSWDFIVVHKGKEKVDSIDVRLVDVKKLDHIQKTTPAGMIVMPHEYSVFMHIDQMYPNGRGSLFAKQFMWKPFSLEHGQFTVDISASTGRFHEDLYIEKVDDKWKYAAKVVDIDTKNVRFMCRDALFPASIAREVSGSGKCWPEIIQ